MQSDNLAKKFLVPIRTRQVGRPPSPRHFGCFLVVQASWRQSKLDDGNGGRAALCCFPVQSSRAAANKVSTLMIWLVLQTDAGPLVSLIGGEVE
jgi:hypothetical protein